MKSLEQYSKEIPEGMLTVSAFGYFPTQLTVRRSKRCRFIEYYRKHNRIESLSPRQRVSARLWCRRISPRPV